MQFDQEYRSTSTRREVIAGLALGLSSTIAAGSARREPAAGISHNMESIHHEVTFKASPERLYALLTNAAEFQQVVLRSDAVKTGMVKDPPPAQISSVEGGTFATFGGYITGRQIELVPNVRIVQAWRTGTWDPGIFSIARFALTQSANGTLLTFDHTGFPRGEAAHLAQGWRSNYWAPLQILSSTSG